METKYYNIAFDVLNYLYLEPSEIETDKFIEYFNKIMIEDDLINNYIKEIETNLFNLGNDNKGREAYLLKNMSILNHTGFFYKNKDLLRRLNESDEEPTVNEKLIQALFMFLFFMEEYFVNYCLDFDIDYKKLHKKSGFGHYMVDIFAYTAGEPDQPYAGTSDFCKFRITQSAGAPEQPHPWTLPAPPLTPPEQTTFKSLFVAPYCLDKKINELKNILETNNFTVKGQWRGITRKGNELAYLYHYLKSNPGVIMTGDFKEQIKVFYDEFGLTVKDKLEPGVFTVTKNLTQYSTRTDTYKNFERLFIQWVQ